MAERVETLTRSIERKFALGQISHELPDHFDQLLADIKNTKQYIGLTLSDLKTEPIQHYFGRALLGWAESDFRAHNEELNSIAFEILGHKEKLVDFTTGVQSQTLETAIELTATKTSHLTLDLLTTDGLITDTLKIGNKPTAENIAEIHKYFKSTIDLAQKLEEDLTKVYNLETKKFRYENRKLDRVQRMKVVRYIDALYFTAHFVSEYENTFQQLIQ